MLNLNVINRLRQGPKCYWQDLSHVEESESGLKRLLFVPFLLPEDIYGHPQFVKSVQFGLEETCLARVAEMETYGLD